MINGSCPTFRQVAALIVLINNGKNFCATAPSELLYAKVRYIKKQFNDRQQRHAVTRYGHNLPSNPAEYMKRYPSLRVTVYKNGLPVVPKQSEEEVEWYGRRFALRKPKDKFSWNSADEGNAAPRNMMEQMSA